MKKIVTKRIVYHDGNGKEIISNTEFDGNLSDENILGALHEIGRTKWIGNSLWVMKNNIPIYRITVERYEQYQKRWYENLFDWIRRR